MSYTFFIPLRVEWRCPKRCVVMTNNKTMRFGELADGWKRYTRTLKTLYPSQPNSPLASHSLRRHWKRRYHLETLILSFSFNFCCCFSSIKIKRSLQLVEFRSGSSRFRKKLGFRCWWIETLDFLLLLAESGFWIQG